MGRDLIAATAASDHIPLGWLPMILVSQRGAIGGGGRVWPEMPVLPTSAVVTISCNRGIGNFSGSGMLLR